MQFYEHIKHTCFVCGAECDGVWAESFDKARAGEGVCLAHSGMAQAEPEPLQAEPEPEVKETIVKVLTPVSSQVELGTAKEVLALVENGTLTPAEAIEQEKAGKNRTTLIKQLESLTNE